MRGVTKTRSRDLLAETLKWMLMERGWKQVELARRAKKSRPWVSRIMNAKADDGLTLTTLDQVASILTVEPWEMFRPDLVKARILGLTHRDSAIGYYAPTSPTEKKGVADGRDAEISRLKSEHAAITSKLFDLYAAAGLGPRGDDHAAASGAHAAPPRSGRDTRRASRKLARRG